MGAKSPALEAQFQQEILGRCTCERWNYQHWFLETISEPVNLGAWLPRGSQYPTGGSQLWVCLLHRKHLAAHLQEMKCWEHSGALARSFPSCFKGAWFRGNPIYKNRRKRGKGWEKGRVKWLNYKLKHWCKHWFHFMHMWYLNIILYYTFNNTH